MTGIVGITALQELRKFKGFERAIIAGGFVRDSILGGSIKDLDIFVPCKDMESFRDTVEQHFPEGEKIPDENNFVAKLSTNEFEDWLVRVEKLGVDPWKTYVFDFNPVSATYLVSLKDNSRKSKKIQDIGNFKGLVWDQNGYRKISSRYLGRYDCKFMDFLDVDIVGFESRSDDFGLEVLSDFHFNTDKVYYDEETVESFEFKKDVRNKESTLCKLNDLQELPAALRKFERLREKYPDFVFRSTVLEIKKEEDNSHRKSAQRFTTSTSTGTYWR